MASRNNSQAHQSGDTSEDKVNEILETLPVLNKLLCSTSGNIQTETLSRSQSAPPALPHVAFDSKLITRLEYHFRLLKLKLGKLEQFQTNVGVELDRHRVTLHSLMTNLESSRVSSQSTYWIKPDLEGIEKKISDLLYQVPLLSVRSGKQKATANGQHDGEEEVHQEKPYYYLPGIHINVENLIKSEAFRQVKQKFMELEIERKICLLSFAVFPENREVHRTMLMYWWIGEGILPVKGAEAAVREILKEFTEKKLVEPVEERRKVAPNSFKMNPFVHASVVLLSKEIGVFDIYGGQDNTPRTSKSEMGKVCLVKGSPLQPEVTSPQIPQVKIETVFNVSERYPDSTVKWFSKDPRTYRRFTINSPWFKSVNVFYLGRWERTKKRHIEVENHKLMKCLKHTTEVKLLSFQGISAIRSLDNSVCKLNKLIILDLRECYDLTQLPEKIDSLQNLVYLDMTGCYMLEWIPLRLVMLKNLEVLKGFVVSGKAYETVACKLKYLNRLPKLRKLSIEINQGNSSLYQLMLDLDFIETLTSLKVTWRRDLVYVPTPREVSIKMFQRTVTNIRRSDRGRVRVPELMRQLKKLNLQRFPDDELPTWLHPQNLLNLKKLHIGGGRRLKGFGDLPEGATQCSVEVLRLTSLPRLRVGWIELKHIYFPSLSFLEKYECPRVTLTPCDGNGIWRSDQD